MAVLRRARECEGGEGDGLARYSGGVALLNHRLQAGTPAGVRSFWVGIPGMNAGAIH